MNVAAELSEHLTLRSISPWPKDTSFTPVDFDALPAFDVDVPAVYRNEQLSQEFQLLYESDRLHGLVGFYYLDAMAATSFDVLLSLTGDVFYGLPGLNGYTAGDVRTRSEEHTSELQSLMRNSYAVFCLKKKNQKARRELSH